MIQAALYARVSTDLQEKEQTIRSQLEALRKYAQDKGYDVVAEYKDEGYSGATLERPGLDQLRDALRCGEFDMVLFHSPDRLARKALYQGLILEELEKAGVKAEFLDHPVDDTPEGKMLLGMQGLFAEYERAKIAERTRRGRLHKARAGILQGGRAPYGYLYIKRDGDRPGSLVLKDEEAEVVQTVYHWLPEEHLSIRRIALRLMESGLPAPLGRLHLEEQRCRPYPELRDICGNRLLQQAPEGGTSALPDAEALPKGRQVQLSQSAPRGVATLPSSSHRGPRDMGTGPSSAPAERPSLTPQQ